MPLIVSLISGAKVPKSYILGKIKPEDGQKVTTGDYRSPALRVTITSLGPFYLLTLNSFNMIVKKNGMQVVNLSVTDGLSVTIFPNSEHEFLMNTKEVAKGYGSTEYAIRQNKSTNQSEFIEGKHFVRGVSISHTQPHQVFWTKRGVVRMGFFVKSKQAKLFRDWAEDLVIERIETAPLKPLKTHDPVEQLMEMALEAGEVEIRRQLFQCYQSLKAYTEDMKNEIDILRVNNDKWCSFIAKKTKNYQLQKGGAKC